MDNKCRPPLSFSAKRDRLDGQSYFLSSTSTYSASITPSSFLASVPAWPEAPSEDPPGAAVLEAAVEFALYIASASLWLAWVSFSCDAFSSAADGEPSSVFLASASADSTSVLSAAATFSPESFSIFSML